MCHEPQCETGRMLLSRSGLKSRIIIISLKFRHKCHQCLNNVMFHIVGKYYVYVVCYLIYK